MAAVFEVPDKDGIPVRLTESVWFRHILLGHPEVEPHLEAIKATISAPTTIHRHAGSIIYSRLGAAEQPPFHLLWLLVVTRHHTSPTPVANVQTVYFTPFPPEKGELIWIKKNFGRR